MIVLADTHALLWAIDTPEKLSGRARETLTDPRNHIWLSTVSLWEIAIKMSAGRIALGAEWRDLIESGRRALRARWLLVEPWHCHEVADLPWHHRDPFDRMLIAQAISEDMTLLTRDRAIGQYEVDVLW
ncbi:MAG: type II toxin-antitoxin system VapC family toxin [Gemmatimonadetes bacterium]|nr:type II toxin-antitoxin system VapC family toxin [Gemmatimonadota bacterium]